MKILVTGAHGQLGTAIQKASQGFRLSDGAPTFFFTDVDTLDICDGKAVEGFVTACRCDMIVNCAAYTEVDRAEDDVERCYAINCEAVGNLGKAAMKVRSKVIHISTDYVFDGRHKKRPYRETDRVNPQSVYGRSKCESEALLMRLCPDSVILRTSWLYSETGKNFVRTMLRIGAERDEAGVVCDQHGSPTYAGDLAAAVLAIVAAESFVPGIYHYSNQGVCSWYEFAMEIFNQAALNCKVKALLSSQYPVRAKRPSFSVLDKTKIKRVYGIVPPEWQDSLKLAVREIIKAGFKAG